MALLLAVLAFLFPVGIYCFFLASINQRSRPLMMHGRWDAIGLLFAASGFFLGTIPILGSELYTRFLGVLVSDLVFDAWWLLWLAYYLLLVCGAWLMLTWRADETAIYHVDPTLFIQVLERALAALGLDIYRHNERFVIHPADPMNSAAITELPRAARSEDRRHAALEVEAFPAMCHVTLHWSDTVPEVRRAIERELEKGLIVATPNENPAAGWFLSVSGMIFGALSLAVLTVVFMILFGKIN